MHLKYPSAVTEAPQRYQQDTTKSGRHKDYANNVAVIDKDRYKNRQEDESNVEYIDEEVENFTEDNIEDDGEEEGMKCKIAIKIFFHTKLYYVF